MNNLQLALQHADMIESMLIESGGEITEEIQAEMRINPKTIGELVDIRYVSMERLESAQAFFKQKAEQYTKIARSLDCAVDYCKESLKSYMTENCKRELVGTDYQFKLVNAAPKVKILDETALDEVYKKSTVVVSTDRKKLLDDLKAGIQVSGCTLEEVYSLRKSINKGNK